uniref:gap junction delta-3 protein-like isoform X2 n=1 Tax=Myxine glutinosa TaxID=7769 RepID=UPI00358F0FBD
MGEWSFLTDLMVAVNEHSTLMGRLWLIIFLIFRVMVIATVGEHLYLDEQEAFVCNTLQPGCNQVCYNAAFPISHFRFWVFQLVVLSAPPLVFVAYTIHQSSKRVRTRRPENAARTRALYTLQVLVRFLFEVLSLTVQYLVYGFTIDDHVTCTRWPCPHRVDCFVSRATEKTVFLLYYFSANVLSVLLCFLELVMITCKTLANVHRETLHMTRATNVPVGADQGDDECSDQANHHTNEKQTPL